MGGGEAGDTVRRGVAVLGVALAVALAGCAPTTRYEAPSSLKSYAILVTRHDSLGRGIAEGLRHRGFSVRDHVRGGSGPTAYLFAFEFRELEPSANRKS